MRHNNQNCLDNIIVLLTISAFTLLTLLCLAQSLLGTTEFDGVIIDKPIINGQTHFVVHHDGTDEVLTNTNNILLNKTNSAILTSQIKVGGRYHFKVNGFRYEPLSQFRNIISATPISGG